MIRIIALIAGAGFVLAVVCFAGAAALGGQDFLRRHMDRDWSVNFHDDDHGDWTTRHVTTNGDGSGPATREITWTGGDSLSLDVPADVQFTQAPGPGKLTINGPKALVDQVTLSDGRLDLNDEGSSSGRLTIAMSAPGVRRFSLEGDESLAIAGLDQDELDVDIAGHGEVSAKGRAKTTRVDISGDGDVDLGKLDARDADVDINGSGRAQVAPTGSATLHISGSGEIDLLSRPASVSSDVTGSGRIVQQPTKS